MRKPRHPKQPKPQRGWMAWNYGIPWFCSLNATRRDCIASVEANLQDPKTRKENFTIRRVTVTAE